MFAGCLKLPWPAWYWDANLNGVSTEEVATWYGSLAMDHQDRTGLVYQRNRYYDARAGQFTQQDPIGIAGGLNLYGYANGDPINFSDPFGLTAYVACRPIGGSNRRRAADTFGNAGDEIE